jgi:hypothetical protein
MYADVQKCSRVTDSVKNANVSPLFFYISLHFKLPREYGVYKLTFSISENGQVLCAYSVYVWGSLYVGTM